MKALVVSHCATSAYVHGLKVLFPDWEVRGAVITIAEQWASEIQPNPGFVQYAQDCDLYIGATSPNGTRHGRLLPEQSQRVLIPVFWFRGFQPDCVHLNGFDSVLGKGGTLYSKIIVASFQAGLSPALTGKLFNLKTYEMFNFLACYDTERQALLNRFQQYGIDLSGSIDRWIARGNFLYSYNHPRIDVLMEILRRALVAADLLPVSELERDDDMGVVDELREGGIWPIYPEIARLHGLPEESLTWRKGRGDNYQTLDLAQFVEASFKALAGKQLPKVPEMSSWVNWIKLLTS
jgi:Polysaccharide biosynthesis enzyme WcbI